MPATIIPCLRCHDAPRMVDWLCDAFGFARHAVHPDGEGGIAHAQLVLGDAMIMLGSWRDDAFGKLQTTVRQAGAVTQSPYVIVADVDALAAHATARGAETLRGPIDEDHGGRHWTCRDPEGNLWSFGTYDPWAKP
jgi:uncharacterized glyoxalase superfamily protein PhnB